jgi:transposase-like protein
MDTGMTKRRNFSDNFKATVALEALRGDKTVQEIAAKRQLHPTQVSMWKRQAIAPCSNVGFRLGSEMLDVWVRIE